MFISIFADSQLKIVAEYILSSESKSSVSGHSKPGPAKNFLAGPKQKKAGNLADLRVRHGADQGAGGPVQEGRPSRPAQLSQPEGGRPVLDQVMIVRVQNCQQDEKSSPRCCHLSFCNISWHPTDYCT